MSWIITAVVVGAGGAGMQMLGQQQSADAMQEATNQFNQKQRALQAQATPIFQKSANQDSLASTQATMDAGAAQRNQLAGALQQSMMPSGMALPATTTATGTPQGRATNIASAAGGARTALGSQAAARMGSMGDWQTNQQINQLLANSQLAPIESMSRENLNLFPTELQSASHAGDNLSQWGQLLGALGSVGMLGAATAPAAAASTGTLANAANTATAGGIGAWGAGGAASPNLWTGLVAPQTPILAF